MSLEYFVEKVKMRKASLR